jgi:hypothetical protein
MASTLAQLTLSVEHANVGVDAEVMPTETGENKELHHMLTPDYTQVVINEPLFVTFVKTSERSIYRQDICLLDANTFRVYAVFFPRVGSVRDGSEIRYFTGNRIYHAGEGHRIFCGASSEEAVANAWSWVTAGSSVWPSMALAA